MNVITRKEAISQDLKRYFTGKPCKHGHVAQRWTSSGHCIGCSSDIRQLEHSRLWKEKNRKRKSETDSRWIASNRERKAESGRRWYLENKKRHRELCRRNKARQQANNPDYRMACAMRGFVRRTLHNKDAPSFDLIGYTPNRLRDHLERQFIKGMSWDNYGEWHIDHITPVSWFIEQGETDPAVINCLSNLRPIWAKDNLSKGDRQTNLI